ncbi:hypothetical protein HK097_010835 [Rhizophlyctis rosea]|uniref:Oxidoreductase n=1 Tax=Rhizophlyctis rosea TaxID=64517 RepID=A0AAD5X8Q7_9FUNG|nr:hypothetical protein HK097_010835 [Rhizophlyctis rosea]
MAPVNFPIKVALLGAGIFAKEAHLPVLTSNPGVFQLVAVYSKSEASAQSVVDILPAGHPHAKPSVFHDSSAQNLEALLANPSIDAVVIALPIPLQPKIISAALAAGKHVFSEKPQAPSVAEGFALLKAYEPYEAQGLVWQVAENFRAEPAIRHGQKVVRDLIAKSGAGSEIRAFDLRTYFYNKAENKYCKTTWRANAEFQGGFVLDGGVHFLALLRAVTGLEPERVTAFTRLTESHLAPLDSVSAAIQLRNGALGTWLLYFMAPQKGAQIELNVVVSGGASGPGGMVTVKLGDDGQGHNGWVVIENLPGAEPQTTFYDNKGVEEEFLGWAKVLGGVTPGDVLPGLVNQTTVGYTEPFFNSARNALGDVALAEAVLQSGEKGGVPTQVQRVI